MRKLIALLFLSLAIELPASNTYVYAPGLDSAIQHWQYPNTTAMTTDFGFYPQDINKIAFNVGDGIYYRLVDTAPTWIPMATGGGGGSTNFLGLIDTPDTYTGQEGKLVVVNGTADGLIFQTAAGGGNVSNVAAPAAEETAVWTDVTHIKGVRTIGGGLTTQVLTKLSNTNYDWGWATPAAGGSTVSITATTPIVVTPDPITGTGAISLASPSDLATIEGLTGTNTIYYRSGASAWSPVVIGANLTFVAGTLAASVSGGGGTVTSVSATSPIQVSPNPITATGTVSIESGSDLAALEALTGTSTIYYRSGISAWSPVSIGSNVTFSAGSLAAGNTNWDTAFTERRQWDGSATNLNATLGRSNLGATTIGANVFTLGNPAAVSWMKVGTAGAITLENAATTQASLGLNTANWDTAYTDRMKWDTSLGISGGTTGQGRTALGATTAGSNLFTLASPATTASYTRVNTSGTITYVSAIPNADLANADIQIANAGARTALGGSVGLDAITGLSGVAGYVKRTAANTFSSVTTIPNADLANDTVTIATNPVALGGFVTQDGITGLGGQPAGLLKRTATNAMGVAVAGTDYKVGTQDSMGVRVITAGGTFTPTTGVRALYVEVVGGGGGSGGCSCTQANFSWASGGGGGGGYASASIAIPQASYTVTIGAGGTAGTAAGGGDGGDGGTTAFGTVCTATGGTGSLGKSGSGFQGATYFSAPGVGGSGTVGLLKITGSDGGNGIQLSVSMVRGGDGGGSVFGPSAIGLAVTNINTGNAGVVGNVYGGGAAGSSVQGILNRAGAAGGVGVIRVWEIF